MAPTSALVISQFCGSGIREIKPDDHFFSIDTLNVNIILAFRPNREIEWMINSLISIGECAFFLGIMRFHEKMIQ
jgi:hypothetical protein